MIYQEVANIMRIPRQNIYCVQNNPSKVISIRKKFIIEDWKLLHVAQKALEPRCRGYR